MGIDISNVNIIECHRLGSRPKSKQEYRPIVVKFLEYAARQAVWNKRSSLAGSKIWLKEDYPAVIERRRKILNPYLRAALQGDPSNPDGRVRAFMKLDKLVLNNQTFTSEMIDAIPHYIIDRVKHPPAMKRTDTITLFFTKECPLSNFYPSTFIVEDTPFINVEQFICFKKAMLFDTREVAKEFLVMREPKDMKRRAKRLKRYDDHVWKASAKDILREALTAKFNQNELLKSELLSTKDTTIGEASPSDVLFGIGLSLFNPNATSPTGWRGGKYTRLCFDGSEGVFKAVCK